MAAEIRVDTIKSRSGINTIFFGGDSISFNQNVGIGTTIVGNAASPGNTSAIVAGIVTCNDVYSVNITNTGIATFSGTSHLQVPVGTTGQRPGSGTAGDFRYNTTDGKFEGYTDSWGEIGGGGATQVSGIVSTTSTVGFAASFAIADYRSASVNFLINDATGASQAGKYIMIHDGTTVTVVEQVAVATGSMLGSLSGAIVGSNAELQVTMVSSGVATCSAKINTMSDSA